MFEVATNLVKAGQTLDDLQDAVDFVDGFVDGQDSSSSVNSRSPNPPVYPMSGGNDARYSVPEEYNSDFITTLRADGGDSSYVSITTVYSGFFDEIVQPQSDRGASAFLKNARGAGASNDEVQVICPPGSPAGSFYSHEGTLYNPLGFTLAIDALSHAGPGRPNRLDLDAVCAPFLTPGLDVTDFLLTENLILIAALTILTYPDPVLNEPPITGMYHAEAHVYESELK
ncbi:hypothetical protein LTR37_015241 [Vermiconidia calcicola]|uniref:Uncharacterized protein n=1 Tax=Vermiconidia calcicola TaxID=1690605 RepID=A0ACC3MSV0_9PEZI|nr:hypothetical protein LTR37_015241 [Vermiconidia calcicola]